MDKELHEVRRKMENISESNAKDALDYIDKGDPKV